MSISVVLVLVVGSESDRAALDAALAAARLTHAHVRVAHVRFDPREALHLLLPESLPLAQEVFASAELESVSRAQKARRAYDEWRDRHSLPEADEPADMISTSYVEECASTSVAVAALGRLADLVVLGGMPYRNGSSLVAFEAALLETGRPVLLVPTMLPVGMFKTALIAWKPTPEAARALAGAMPLLEQAENVRIFAASDDSLEPGEAEGLIEYLAWHDIVAMAPSFRSGSNSVGAALLRQADRLGATILVLGGYGHSRLSELVFGGVTRHVLENATLPTLIAH